MRGGTGSEKVGNPIGWAVLALLGLHALVMRDPIPLLILMAASLLTWMTTFQK